ncbi:hypothetical protein BDQ12DRAFT_666337 [Crucibulum laeve]|uniref:Uncharacterized protein n=1 Tax=Crucibulum laeve TaxID=68775 RepID=A0A5C3LZI3_9AGAR|nr:hypothetical protein BDQ12DRAFT_666337 [Crucibulum laeve]
MQKNLFSVLTFLVLQATLAYAAPVVAKQAREPQAAALVTGLLSNVPIVGPLASNLHLSGIGRSEKSADTLVEEVSRDLQTEAVTELSGGVPVVAPAKQVANPVLENVKSREPQGLGGLSGLGPLGIVTGLVGGLPVVGNLVGGLGGRDSVVSEDVKREVSLPLDAGTSLVRGATGNVPVVGGVAENLPVLGGLAKNVAHLPLSRVSDNSVVKFKRETQNLNDTPGEGGPYGSGIEVNCQMNI